MTTGPQTAEQIEAAIAEGAAEIRGDAVGLRPELFLQLWPLLLLPIPEAYIETIPAVTGKPYVSTGIKSVQVQIDRMNNVLTPLWWWQAVDYEAGGTVCHVEVFVGDRHGEMVEVQRFQERQPETIGSGVLASGESWGGVDRGSTKGNVYKGSYTNAAKRAFAALGVGHEIYLGTTDLDPDVSPPEGEQAAAGDDLAAKLWDRAFELGLVARLQLTASHIAGRDVGPCDPREKGIAALASLTLEQMNELDTRLQRKADEQAAKQ